MSFEVITRLRFNKETDQFSIVEAGFKYEIPNSLYNDFKAYIMQYDLVSRWYKQLKDSNRNMVNRVSTYS